MTKKKTAHKVVQILIYLLLCMNVLLTLENFKVFAKQEDPPPWRPWIVTGVQKLVVVCVEFSDVLHSTDALTIESRLGNMAEYFNNMSFGNMTLDIMTK